MNKLSGQISRLVICGNSVHENEKSNEVMRASYRTAATNKIVYADLDESYDRFE